MASTALRVIELTTDETESLRAFKAKYGAWWKSALLHKWKTGTCHLEQNGRTLRRIGDEFGPQWLKTYRLPNHE